jgi:spermidine synthase
MQRRQPITGLDKPAEINRDRNLRLQYPAGLGLNTNAAGTIYDQMPGSAVFPENLFTGSPEPIAALRARFHRKSILTA